MNCAWFCQIIKLIHCLYDIRYVMLVILFQDVLFPYATENVEKYLESSWEDQNVQDAVEGMRQQAAKDVEAKIEGAVPIPDKVLLIYYFCDYNNNFIP